MEILRTGTLRQIAAMRTYLRLFRKNGGHIWGPAAAQAPLHTAFSALARYKQTSFLYITACEPSFGGCRFFGENVSNISVKFVEKLGQLWGAGARRPQQISKFKPPYCRAKSFLKFLAEIVNSYCLGGPRSARPRWRPPKMEKFLWQHPPHPRVNSMV